MRTALKRALLITLLALDGDPMPESSLLSSAQAVCRHLKPTLSDAQEALKDCEAEGYCAGVSDEFSGEAAWTLTTKGTAKARQIR